MKQCKCGSMAFNLAREGIDQGDLCDRHYWQDRAEKAEKDAARYQFMRRLNVPQFKALFISNLSNGIPFDSMIDAAIAKDAP